jgi:uncharacterized membrane protein
MTQHYAQGNFHEGTLGAIEQVNHLLRTHFPLEGPGRNELPDRPLML